MSTDLPFPKSWQLQPPPRTARQARRSLRVFKDRETGRFVVGSMWLPTRIIADTEARAREAAMQAYEGTLPNYPRLK